MHITISQMLYHEVSSRRVASVWLLMLANSMSNEDDEGAVRELFLTYCPKCHDMQVNSSKVETSRHET